MGEGVASEVTSPPRKVALMIRPCCSLLILLNLVFKAWGDDFPRVIDTEPDRSPVLPAEQAAAGFRVPPGFRVSVFAAEPEVRNPIAMAWDARGRLWVAENYTYAERAARFDLRFRDRVVVFEDSDGDGRPEKRSVFTDDVQVLTSVEVGRGGTWLMCPPQLLFVPDRNGDDRPDAAPEVVLDGFTVPTDNYHNFANGLRWGPDGWLYGRCGASAPGRIGVPGTPEADRIPLHGGIWRYEPTTRRVEVLTHGTTNPWGHDWDALGEAFFINTVNGHLWHMIPGAHFVASHATDPNPHAYQAIDQHADHFHWDTAKSWTDSRVVSTEHDRRGGGHAHSGMMIYNGDQWPAADRGKLFTLNFHGRRTNVERLERSGTGFVGIHEPDRFFAADPKFRGIDLSAGPDGSVFALDWSDSGECHDNNGVHRNSGRIYQFQYGTKPNQPTANLATADLAALVGWHGASNEWFPRMARRQLIDRAQRGESVEAAVTGLKELLTRSDPRVQLQAVWTLFGLGRADDALLRSLLHQDHEALRVWGIRLLTDRLPLDTVTSQRPRGGSDLPADLLVEFARMAREDASGLVRLTLASTLQRLPVAQRPTLAAPLLARNEDADDHNQPLMLWYGVIPVAAADPAGLARLALHCALPTTRRLMARCLAEGLDTRPEPVNDLLGTTDEAALTDFLDGIADGLRGWRKAPKPRRWDEMARGVAASNNIRAQTRVRELGVVFGDGRALAEIRGLALNDKADLETRRAALRSLIEDRPADLRSICEQLLRTRSLNATAVRGLALVDDPAVGQTLIASYRSFAPTDRPALIDTLVVRKPFASALLDALAAGTIPRTDVSSYQARQIRSLGDPALTTRLADVWGVQRETSAAKKETIERLKTRHTPEFLATGDRSAGRAVFGKLCASCHMLYGQGGAIGPDLTGSGRDNLDYLLENIVEPSATVSADFKVVVVAMRDGRVLNGLLRAPTDRTITLQSQNEAMVLARDEIERIEPSPLSLMPEGLLDTVSPAEVRDLLAYLIQKTQVPLPVSADSAGR